MCGRREGDYLSFPPIPKQFVSYGLAKLNVFIVQKELAKFFRLKKKLEKKKIAFYRIQRIDSHKWFHRTSALA